ncbi:MAG TPA: Zn-ribbon domain-containing OB-fold protein [Deltaproteobacteria bacterium]|nr:Zn-ribbon domain-containing OB-fold protein [Candidatus Binatota bacterium]HIL13726.1 Zn-ribbon domain-containing OB-fold protein [Deltaproteobacteria bacterium]
MSEKVESSGPLPAVPYIKLPEGADPYLEGQKCSSCGAVYLGQRMACGKCFSREKFEAVKLSDRGTLHVFSIVHRSFPGVEVPFVSAIVDLEGGGTVKGNLVGVEPEPGSVELGMPVDVFFDDAGRKDGDGNSYVSYFFRPAA